MPELDRLSMHLVSDSTGETVQSLAHAAAAQFDDVEINDHVWPMIRTSNELGTVLDKIAEDPGVVLYTLVNPEFRQKVVTFCRERQIPAMSVLDPLIDLLSRTLGRPPRRQPGLQHLMDGDYFGRIDAMHYALAHDDGQGEQTLFQADVVVIGVSRTSKTPTCMYLANRGIKAANVPFVAGIGLPAAVIETCVERSSGPQPLLTIGLIKDPDRLVQVRLQRLKMLSADDGGDYVDLERVEEEMQDFRRLCARHRWPVIDVTRRSIEETAATILKMVERNRPALSGDVPAGDVSDQTA